MLENIKDILNSTEFNDKGVYAISGKALNEIVKLFESKKEAREIQGAIDWFYSDRDEKVNRINRIISELTRENE